MRTRGGFFKHFSCPYTFYSPNEYETWLHAAGLIPKRLELIPKDMMQKGREALAGWIRTTWLPYTERIPEKQRNAFIDETIRRYLQDFPEDKDDVIHVKMMWLEVEAVKKFVIIYICRFSLAYGSRICSRSRAR